MTFTKKCFNWPGKYLKVAQEGLELPQSAEIDFRAAVVTTMPRYCNRVVRGTYGFTDLPPSLLAHT